MAFIVSTAQNNATALSNSAVLVITATGSIVPASAPDAVTVSGTGASVLVAGTIGADDDGVSGSGTLRLDVTQVGAIMGGGTALEMTSGFGIVSNAGTMSGGPSAINFTGTELTVVNSGTMIGTNSTGLYASAGGNLLVTNSGMIGGTNYGIYQFGAGTESIGNTGTISGRIASLFLSDAVSTVTNSGLLLGDVLLGGGADLFDGTLGTQGEVFGGSGADTIHGGAGAETLNGDAENDALSGNGGMDRLLGGTLSDRLRGGADEDWLEGGSGQDRLFGNRDDDTLSGDDDNDKLWGGEADDSLFGGLGDDQLTGGTGDDTMSGGAGVDTFIFLRGQGTDWIASFQNDVDKIDLRAFDFASSAAVIALASAAGGSVRIDLPGEGVLFVQGLFLGTLNINDLLL